MKKIMLLILLLSFTASAFSQDTITTPVFSKEYYLQKSKNQKTAAWILFGGGSVMLIIVAIIELNTLGDKRMPSLTFKIKL